MELYKIKNLSFTYPQKAEKAIDNISFSVNKGEFVLIIGQTGCGKTTLLRLLKNAVAPSGKINGNIIFNNKPLNDCSPLVQAEKIGFVMQNPDSQIVTDKVWHELSFGLENLGYSNQKIRTKVSEMASFFGIEKWFHKKTSELSGGQKQLLNLASVMVMNPDVLLLDEPTSQLDPISAGEFIKTLEKINKEFSTTIIMCEHRLDDVFSVSDRVIVMDNGKIISDSTPEKTGKILSDLNHSMYDSMPTTIKVHHQAENADSSPVTIRDAKIWLNDYVLKHSLSPDKIQTDEEMTSKENIIELKVVRFKYDKNSDDILKGLNLKINKGEIFSILGGNGSGKTTLLSLISGLLPNYAGKILINGHNIQDIKNLYTGTIGVLPQNPQNLFTKKTVLEDLRNMISDKSGEKDIEEIAKLLKISHLFNSHPYDLSGGEQQRLALSKILLLNPEILLLDEPTKGLDSSFKNTLSDILISLKKSGKTIIIVSHDIEFCAGVSDRCSLLFDGDITSTGTPRTFFSGNRFYTTNANKIAGNTIQNAIFANDIIIALGKTPKEKNNQDCHVADFIPKYNSNDKKQTEKRRKLTTFNITLGIIFVVLFLALFILQLTKMLDFSNGMLQIISLVLLSLGLSSFLPKEDTKKIQKKKSKFSKKTLISLISVFILIPLTIFAGTYLLEDRRYYFISIVIIIEILIPFLLCFEEKKPQARELVLICSLCAITVLGRTAFYTLPQFKPMLSLIIITGVCFGAETGFLVGAVSAFLSNFFFGQGPWTVWQMFSSGLVGFFAGVIFEKLPVKASRLNLSIFGFLAVFIIYGLISNSSMVLMYETNPTFEMFLASIIAGFPFDLIHAISTVFFLWFISGPMIDILERIKTKYNLIE